MLFQLFQRSEKFINEKIKKNPNLELKKYLMVYSEDVSELQRAITRLKKSDTDLKELTKVTLIKPNLTKKDETEFLPCTDKDKLSLMKS
jgi:hypothetical protein